MNFVRNRLINLINEATYGSVLVGFTGIGIGVGMYEGLKEIKKFKTPHELKMGEKITHLTLYGITGASLGLVSGATSPLWIPIAIISTGVYSVDLIYYEIFKKK